MSDDGDDCIHPFPGPSLRLVRMVDTAWHDVNAVTGLALDAVDALRPVWSPLSAEAVVILLDGDDPFSALASDPPRPHWLLVQRPLPAGLRISPLRVDPVMSEAAQLSREALAAWLSGALTEAAATAAPGGHADWTELAFETARAWVGPPGWRADATEARLRHEGAQLRAPIERDAAGAWLSGPRDPAFDQPPLRVAISHDLGSIALTVTRNYSFWTEDGQPAAARLSACLAALAALGWE